MFAIGLAKRFGNGVVFVNHASCSLGILTLS